MRNKIIIIAAFAFILGISSIDVNAQRSVKTNTRTTRKIQNVRVTLTENGYQPSSFKLRKNIAARITFIRKPGAECGDEVVFPAFNLRRALPLNKPVTLIFTPKKTGTFGFACGMDMYKGKVTVQ